MRTREMSQRAAAAALAPSVLPFPPADADHPPGRKTLEYDWRIE